MELDSTAQQYPFWFQTPKGTRAFACPCSQSPGGDPQLEALKAVGMLGVGGREERAFWAPPRAKLSHGSRMEAFYLGAQQRLLYSLNLSS